MSTEPPWYLPLLERSLPWIALGFLGVVAYLLLSGITLERMLVAVLGFTVILAFASWAIAVVLPQRRGSRASVVLSYTGGAAIAGIFALWLLRTPAIDPLLERIATESWRILLIVVAVVFGLINLALLWKRIVGFLGR